MRGSQTASKENSKKPHSSHGLTARMLELAWHVLSIVQRNSVRSSSADRRTWVEHQRAHRRESASKLPCTARGHATAKLDVVRANEAKHESFRMLRTPLSGGGGHRLVPQDASRVKVAEGHILSERLAADGVSEDAHALVHRI